MQETPPLLSDSGPYVAAVLAIVLAVVLIATTFMTALTDPTEAERSVVNPAVSRPSLDYSSVNRIA